MNDVYGLYFPKNPDGLFTFLNSVEKDKNATEFHLFVDNNDHKISYRFYDIRKYIKKGFNITLHIYPSIGTEKEVYELLQTKIPNLNGFIFEPNLNENQ